MLEPTLLDLAIIQSETLTVEGTPIIQYKHRGPFYCQNALDIIYGPFLGQDHKGL